MLVSRDCHLSFKPSSANNPNHFFSVSMCASPVATIFHRSSHHSSSSSGSSVLSAFIPNLINLSFMNFLEEGSYHQHCCFYLLQLWKKQITEHFRQECWQKTQTKTFSSSACGGSLWQFENSPVLDCITKLIVTEHY